MNKEEILAKSREENRKQDEMEKNAYAQAGSWAAKIGGLVCAVLLLLDNIYTGSLNYGNLTVYCSIYGTMSLVISMKLKKKYSMISCAIFFIFALLCMISYIRNLIGY